VTRHFECRSAVLLVLAEILCYGALAKQPASLEKPAKPSDAARWVGFSTPHFELYTTNDESTAYEAVQRFEVLHDFFQQLGMPGGLPNTTPGSRVRVIAFRSAREFSAHQVSPAACAYYQRTRSGDYIVMQDLEPDHYQVGVHEYTHFLFRGSGLKLPLWLNEGLAEFYSSLESRNGQVIVGRPPYGRLRSLRTQSWITLKTLFSAGQASPYYTQADKMAIFYAESWALTHMLAMQADYAAQFSRLLALISGGTPALEAIQILYHKNPDQLISDLNDYLQQRLLPVRAVNLAASYPAASHQGEPQSLASVRAQVDFALADLAAANPYSGLGAAAPLDDVSKRYPDSPEAEESLGYYALNQNRPAEARTHFAKALERHSSAPDVLFYAAHLDLEAGAPLGPVIDLLQKVLLLDPGHYNARFDLGFAAAKATRFDLALSTLNNMPDVRPEHRYLLTYTIAYCYIHLNRVADAQAYADQASRLAANDANRLQTDQLLRYISYRAVKTGSVNN
jgi:tetratricopeptide (TPR) repeat protein